MTPDEQRIAIAEACGWKWYVHPVARANERKYRFLALPAVHEFEQSPEWMIPAAGEERLCSMDYMSREFHLPDYLTDLNAMHEAEKCLDSRQCRLFADQLMRVLKVGFSDNLHWHFVMIHTTASERAEAFLRTIGKWKE